MRNNLEWFKDILDAIQQIEKYSAKGEQEFSRNELIQIWMVHHLQIIGEAANKISKDFQSKYSEIKWRDIIAMRNLLIHEYFGVDIEEIWNTVQTDLPELKQRISEIISDIQNN